MILTLSRSRSTCKNLVGHSSPMLHIKSRLSAFLFWRIRFLKCLQNMGVTPSWSCDRTIYTNFSPPTPHFLEMLYMKFDLDWPNGFRGVSQADDGCQSIAPCEHDGSG